MRINLKHVGGFLAVVAFAACSDGTPTGPETTESVDGVETHQVADIGMFKMQRQLVAEEALQCETIDFSQLAGGTYSTPGGALTLSALGVDVDVSITDWTDVPADNACGTGQVLIFDTSVPSSVDNDLVLAGQSVTPNLGNVAAHQSCNTDPAVTPNDADVPTNMQFVFPNGDWVVKGYTALDQEGPAPDNEFIALNIDVATDGSQVGITDITVNNDGMIEVVDVDPDASFSSTLDFEFNGSGAIDDIEVCKVVERGGEGCTPGYWRQSQHFGNWPVDIDFTVAEAFDGFCGVMGQDVDLQNPESGTVCGLTLLEALQLKGGHVNALMRHAAAAWLNAGSTVDFHYAQSEVEDMTEAALMSGMYKSTKNGFEEANEAGCPLGRAELEE